MKGNIFIKRPVMAISISVLILVIGLISLFTLPVEQYPDIAPPTVYVSANYTGADAEAVLNSVIMPLEESINGVENMMYISSTSTDCDVEYSVRLLIHEFHQTKYQRA
jgi:multidrug efflux pump subunit AcrB